MFLQSRRNELKDVREKILKSDYREARKLLAETNNQFWAGGKMIVNSNREGKIIEIEKIPPLEKNVALIKLNELIQSCIETIEGMFTNETAHFEWANMLIKFGICGKYLEILLSPEPSPA
jgi:hypothetical protein